jgi:hypothetical protein
MVARIGGERPGSLARLPDETAPCLQPPIAIFLESWAGDVARSTGRGVTQQDLSGKRQPAPAHSSAFYHSTRRCSESKYMRQRSKGFYPGEQGKRRRKGKEDMDTHQSFQERVSTFCIEMELYWMAECWRELAIDRKSRPKSGPCIDWVGREIPYHTKSDCSTMLSVAKLAPRSRA